MIARAKEAAKTGTIRGLIFYQGESDADTFENATRWGERCAVFISNVRSDLRLSDLPVIVTELGPDPGDPSLSFWSDVQASQAAMSGTALAVVSAADLATQVSSSIHLTTASYVTLGGRYATAMASMLA